MGRIGVLGRVGAWVELACWAFRLLGRVEVLGRVGVLGRIGSSWFNFMAAGEGLGTVVVRHLVAVAALGTWPQSWASLC